MLKAGKKVVDEKGMPEVWQEALVPIYMGKGERIECMNHR